MRMIKEVLRLRFELGLGYERSRPVAPSAWEPLTSICSERKPPTLRPSEARRLLYCWFRVGRFESAKISLAEVDSAYVTAVAPQRVKRPGKFFDCLNLGEYRGTEILCGRLSFARAGHD